MTSYQIPVGSLLTPIQDILPLFLERDDKIFSKEPKNLAVKTEFLEDPSTNRNESDPYKKSAKDASKAKILWTDILKDEHNELDENKCLSRFMKT